MVHADWSIQISEVLVICKATMGDKSVETLGSKIELLSVLVTFSPLPPKTLMLIFPFLRLHRTQRLHNIELGGWGY